MSLPQAKERLKLALNRLENAVEKRVAEAKTSASPSANDLETAKKLSAITEENQHLREENQSLQSAIGNEQQKTASIKTLNNQIKNRVDGLVGELEKVLEKTG